MTIRGYTTADILERIVLTLPSRFTRDEGTNIVGLFEGISAALKLDTDLMDEFYRQTNLYSASGEYVDDFINGHAKIGRNDSESDDDYKARYQNIIYTYKSTKSGLQQIVIDLMGKTPQEMYNQTRKGAFFNARYYYNDGALYGSRTAEPYTGYIKFSRKPNYIIFNQLCKTISKCKAAGIRIYLYYPAYNDLQESEFEDGSFERTELE